MRLVLLLLIVVACDAGQTKPGSTKQPVKPTSPACATDADLKAKQAEVDADDKRSYEAAVAAQKMYVVILRRTEETLGDGLREDLLTFDATVQPITRDDGTFLAGVTYWSQNGNAGPDPDFVLDGKQHVFAVERIRTAAGEAITRCGCQPFSCGSPCPACGDTRRVLYGPLPKGVTFKGTVKIEYAGRAMSTPYANGACPPEPCPP